MSKRQVGLYNKFTVTRKTREEAERMDVNCTECGDVRFGHGLDCNTRISNLRWYASNYLDDDRCGVVDDDDTIIVRLSEGKSREECERIATEHNEKRITESSPSAAPPVE